MASSKHLVVACLLILNIVQVRQAARNTKPGINAKPYRILCDIYNTAANPPKTLYDQDEIESIRSRIDVINASLADEDWFGEIAKTDEKDKLSDTFKARNKGYEGFFRAWREAVKKVGENHEGFKKLPTLNPAVAIAHMKLRKIENQVEKIVLNLKQLNTSAKLEQIKENFDDAIGEKSCQDATTCGVTGDRGSTTCGTAAGARGTGGVAGTTISGTNLIVDFFCLCAARQDESGDGKADGKECIETEGKTGSHTWGGSPETVVGGRALWDKLKAGCALGHERTKATAEGGARALSNFLGELGSVTFAAESSVAAKQVGTGILGVCAVTSGLCSGACDGDMSSTNKGICVAYGTKTSDWEKVDWFVKMKNGLQLLRDAEALAPSVQHDIAHLKILQTRAEEIYEEAKASLEIAKVGTGTPTENNSQKQNPSSSADKSTAQEPSTVSAATDKSFFLPWALLI